MSELMIFNYDNKEIRTVEKDGQFWWVLRDVCEILSIGNQSDVYNRLDEDEKGVGLIDTLGGKQKMNIINESGLYNVILRSDKMEAKPFRKWVTSEVLPSIHKHGAYMTSETIEMAILNPDTMIKLCIALKEERGEKEQLKLENSKKDQMIGELKPKADYTDRILQSKALVTITQIAKDYGMSGNEMNRKLHEMKIQYKQNNQWLLYCEHQAKGYTHSETIHFVRNDGMPDTKMVTKWTQKGRLFLYEKLKKKGVLPVIEKDNSVA